MAFLIAAARADEWFLLPEPSFMGYKVMFPIAGAKGTVLAPARMGRFGIEFPTVKEWAATGLSDDAVRESTRKLSSDWFKQVKPRLVRNAKKVVEYALLQSDAVPVSVTIFAPEFRKEFEDVFGPKMRVVIPNRQTVFVFPGLAADYSQYARLIIEAWRSPAAKVSLEVFELGEQGFRAVGKFEEP